MRVAILEVEPRVCGPTSWAFRLRHGMQELGHHCDVVSYTKSGKRRSSWGKPIPGGRWWSESPDVVVKEQYLQSTLDSYDMIVLPEIKVPLHDKQALKLEDGSLPLYVEVLKKTTARWTTALHGSFYPAKDAPFLEQLLDSPNRGASLVTMSDASVESNEMFKQVGWIKGPMPYIPRCAIDLPLTDNRTVGTSGRFIYNKGQPLVALAGTELPEDVTVEVWGSSAVGRGPSPTYIVYEILRDHYKAKTKRYGNPDPIMNRPDGNIVTPFPWDARLEGHALIRYLGNYTDPVATARRFRVHANLTAYNFARGLVEYSTLEAADAGALCIVPQHLSDPQFRMMVLDWYTASPTQKRLEEEVGKVLIKKVAEAFETCLNIDDASRFEIVKHNREVLRTRNDPKLTAQVMIDSAFSS
jgi:hypothetical protein